MKNLQDASSSEDPALPTDPSFSNPQQLPKDYDAALERVAQALEGQQPSSQLEKVVFGVGLFIAILLLTAQLLHLWSYPSWLELLYSFAIFVEACLPLGLSFFLKNKQQATILRGVGIIVLIIYALHLFS